MISFGNQISLFDMMPSCFPSLIICFVCCGVEATLWMDDNFFDPERTRAQADDWREYARCTLWFVYLPIVALLVRLGVKYKMPSERRRRKK